MPTETSTPLSPSPQYAVAPLGFLFYFCLHKTQGNDKKTAFIKALREVSYEPEKELSEARSFL